MKQSRFSRLLDYIPPIIAFGAAIVALVGAPKWDASGVGLAKITRLGWTVFGIGVVALFSSLLVTRRNHAVQSAQKRLKLEIARIGQEQLLRGIERVVCVFRNSRLWHKGKIEPDSPLDLLNQDRRSALASLNLNAESDYYDGKINVKWWVMFEDTAKQGSAQLTTALQIYVTFLEPELIASTTRLLNCEFMHRLQHIHSIINANTRGEPERPVTFFWVSADDRHPPCGYEEFWELVASVIRLCTRGNVAEPVRWIKLDEGRDG